MSEKLGIMWRTQYGVNGGIQCFTCETVIMPHMKLDRGHFLPKKKYKAHWFNEDTIRPQCASCNMTGQGEQWAFMEGLLQELGEDALLEIWNTRHDGYSEDRDWYIERIQLWQKL